MPLLEGEPNEVLINSPFSGEFAMPQVEAPVTGGKVDSSDLPGSAMSIVKAIGGVGLATVVVAYGQDVGDYIRRTIGNATGVQSSQDNGFGFRGSL